MRFQRFFLVYFYDIPSASSRGRRWLYCLPKGVKKKGRFMCSAVIPLERVFLSARERKCFWQTGHAAGVTALRSGELASPTGRDKKICVPGPPKTTTRFLATYASSQSLTFVSMVLIRRQACAAHGHVPTLRQLLTRRVAVYLRETLASRHGRSSTSRP